jgi:uncharacterized protein YukE
MADIRINVDGMKALINQLDQADDRMRDACARLNKVGPAGLGTDGLDNACDDFQDDWGDGITRIADASNNLYEGLKKTLEAYEANEEQTSKGFTA